MKKYIFTFILIAFCTQLTFAQNLSLNRNYLDQIEDCESLAELDEEEGSDMQAESNPDYKSVPKALFFSMILPGAGQIYTEKKYGFIYTAIEVVALTSYFIYNKKGHDKIDEYEKFADEHYNRDKYMEVKSDLVDRAIEYADETNTLNIYVEYDSENKEFYEGQHFSLDEENTQHYYEDIGKYNKYIFGWDDWYSEAYYYLLENEQGISQGEYFEYDEFFWDYWNPNEEHVIPDEKLYSEETEEGIKHYYVRQNSANRSTYRSMRHDANNYHSIADVSMGVVLANHVISAVDAARLARKHNKALAKKNENQFDVDFGVDWQTSAPQATLAFTWKY